MERPPLRPHRVVLIEGNRDGTVGGSYQCLHDLARHMDRSRFEPVAVFWHDNRFAAELRNAGVEVHLLESSGGQDRGSGGRLGRLLAAVAYRRRFLRMLRAEVLHLNNSPEVGYTDWLPAARLLRIPVLTHARAPAPRISGAVRRRMVGSYDRVIAISEYVLDTLRNAGIARRRLVRIHDGIDVAALRAAALRPVDEVRRSLQVPADGFLLVMAGNLKRWKGQHVLLDAVARTPVEVRARCYVAFAGAAPAGAAGYEAELRAFAAREGLAERTRFLGPRGDVPALMNAADVVVHASTQPEPFGLVVLEGMALGKPVVASRLGGPAETVAPGTGLLFDPAAPDELAGLLRRLLHDAPLRRALGEAARLRAQEFSIERNVAAIQAVYAGVLGGRARHAAPA
jgi:glycosyltransferase involved in cell wall biosynthesis